MMLPSMRFALPPFGARHAPACVARMIYEHSRPAFHLGEEWLDLLAKLTVAEPQNPYASSQSKNSQKLTRDRSRDQINIKVKGA